MPHGFFVLALCIPGYAMAGPPGEPQSDVPRIASAPPPVLIAQADGKKPEDETKPKEDGEELGEDDC